MSHGPASQAPYEGNLSGSFADHPKANAWASEEGKDQYCWELPYLESTTVGESRHQDAKLSPAWNTTTIVNTGSTSGSGADYHSELPNH